MSQIPALREKVEEARKEGARYVLTGLDLWEPLLDVVEAASKELRRPQGELDYALSALEDAARTALQEPEDGQ